MNTRQKKKFETKFKFKTYKRVKDCICENEIELAFARVIIAKTKKRYLSKIILREGNIISRGE